MIILRYLRLVLGPALLCAIFVGSAFAGIGGMGLTGTSEMEVLRLWEASAVLAIFGFLIALYIFTRRLRSLH